MLFDGPRLFDGPSNRDLYRRLRPIITGMGLALRGGAALRFDHHVEGWPRLSVDHPFHPLSGSRNEVRKLRQVGENIVLGVEDFGVRRSSDAVREIVGMVPDDEQPSTRSHSCCGTL